MATATPPRGTVDRQETDRRVRHPLQALRGYIRLYVTLEGLGVAAVYIALAFWIGLAFDYGLFKLLGIDWIQTIQEMDPAGGNADMWPRGIILGLIAGGLLAVVAFKVFFRLLREFNDPALALVLERRFPRELGDRVITAVELADPQLARKYGYSQILVEKTINEAADRVEQVPVKGVFNWKRLVKLGLLVLVLTVGLYLAIGAAYFGVGLASGNDVSVGDYAIRFHHVASAWTERDVLLMNTYWPRNAFLKLIRFQEAADKPGVMRIGRDEQRPDLQVRAFQYLVADSGKRGGWRPLVWTDLDRFVGKDLLDRVAIPPAWDGWIIDLDDLDPAIPATSLPGSWQGKTTGFVRRELGRNSLRTLIGPALLTTFEATLDWRTWTVDKIAAQEGKGEVRRQLRLHHSAAHQALEQVLSQIDSQANDVWMERVLRKVPMPGRDGVSFHYRGKKYSNPAKPERASGANFFFNLAELKESVDFTVRAADFATPEKKIELVPPPALVGISLDKEEPAYIYYRLQGNQKPLKGLKQITKNKAAGVTGEVTVIPVAFGTNLTLTAQADRPLKPEVRMRRPVQSEERGAVTPHVPVRFKDDRTFLVRFEKVEKTIEFIFEFADRDNVRGKRRVVIRPVDDRAPEVIDMELAVVLRKPRFQTESGKSAQGTPAEGFLITPDAQLPFKGLIRDDYGLDRVDWVYELDRVQIELIGGMGNKDKLPTLVLQGPAQVLRGSLVASGFQFLPGVPGMELAGPSYWAWVHQVMAIELALSARRNRQEGSVPLDGFVRRQEEQAGDELTLAALEKKLQGDPPTPPRLIKEHNFLKDNREYFDLKEYLPKIKSRDPSKEPQFHYKLRLSLVAQDNNVETGPSPGRNRIPFTFLVVSENELLAQIFLEEEMLRERLKKALDKIDKARVSINEQSSKLANPASDLSLVAIRVDEIRRALTDTASVSREVHADYSKILQELIVNRVGFDKGRQKIEDVQTKIVEPLFETINPNFGQFANADDAVNNLFKGLEDDLAILRAADEKTLDQAKLKIAPNRPGHQKNADILRERLDNLYDKLNSVLLAMDEGIVFGRLLETILRIERRQRDIDGELRAYFKEFNDELLKGILK